jgi:hypothetical protein
MRKWHAASQVALALVGRLEAIPTASPSGDQVPPLGAAPSALLGAVFESAPPADWLHLVRCCSRTLALHTAVPPDGRPSSGIA